MLTDTAEAIRRASAAARDAVMSLDADMAARLKTLYQDVITEMQQRLRSAADAADAVSVQRLNTYLTQAQNNLLELDRAQRGLLREGLTQAAEWGVKPWLEVGVSLDRLADDAVRFVEHFVAADGLRLSDRLWRITSGTMNSLAETLRRNVVLGRDATQAALEFTAKQQALPLELRAALGKDRPTALGKAVDDVLRSEPGAAYAKALRVFRTEINRAHGEAYQRSTAQHPDVIGMQFMLSPNHPRRDICDTLAEQNLHGLGAGVYPLGQAPWPAHPNTMSFLVAVFRRS